MKEGTALTRTRCTQASNPRKRCRRGNPGNGWTRGSPGFAFAVVLLLLQIIAVPAQAQERLGGLELEVLRSETARPLPDARVVLVARDGTETGGVTDDDGRLLLDALPEGLYRLRVEAPGRRAAEEPVLRIVANRVLPYEVLLPLLDESALELEEVVVIGRAVSADPFGAVSESFLNREELRVAPGTGSDVLRALDGLPGLVSTGEFANFSVRGRGPRDNLILVDDMPFDKVLHFDQSLGELEDIDGGGRYSIFAPETISGAWFSPGGWSAAYGGRSGSLLRLDVVGGAPTPRSTLRLDLAGVEFLHEGPSGFHEDTSLLFTARQFDFGRVFEFVDEEDIGTPELTDVIFKTRTELTDRDTFEVLAIYATEDYTRDVENAQASENFEDLSLIDASQDVSFLALSWERLVGDTGEWTNRLYYRDSDKTTTEGEAFPDLVPPDTPPELVPVREDIISIDERESELGWRSDLSFLNRFGSFSTGLRVTDIDLDYDTVLSGPWDRFVYRSEDPRPPGQNYVTLLPENVNSSLDEGELSWAAYVEQTLERERWDLRAGLRYDFDGFSDEGYVSPRFSLNYRLSQATRLSATAGLFYQSPRFLDRASDPGNARLANERITHFSVGVTQRFGDRWELLVEAYAQQLDDLVTEDQRTSGTFTNAGDGDNMGVDVVLTRRFADGIAGNITYSYNDLRLNDNDGLGEYDGDNSRPHFFSVGGSWEISERWLLSARWKWASGVPIDDFIVYEDVLGAGQPLRFSKELTTRNTLRADDFNALNLRVDYRRPLGPVNFVAFLDVINVIGGEGASPPEFNPRTGLDVVEEGEALPIIGLILEKNW